MFDVPIEDGVTHPAEAAVERVVGNATALALVMRLLGRMDYRVVKPWGVGVAAAALQHEDAEVREAAVRALEEWRGWQSLTALRGHADSEPWINYYTQMIIEELTMEARE